MIQRLAAPFIAALFLACGSSGGNGDGPDGPGADGGVNMDGSTGTTGFPVRWEVALIEDGNTGWVPSIARAPNGTIGVAYLRRAAQSGTCTKSGAMNAPVARWDVMYASSSGGAFTTEVATTIDLLIVTSVGLSFDDNNQPAIAFMGGNETQYICGGTDAMLARKTGANWMITTVDTDGTATPLFQVDADECAAFQNTCNAAGPLGVVGTWPAIAHVQGQPVVLFRDTHFGFADDDESNSDLELWWNGQRSTLDATWGGGIYTAMAADGMGNLYAAHANKYSTTYGDGIWAFRNAAGMWTRQKISDELLVGPKLSLAARGAKVGLAYHASEQNKLRYIEAADGMTWSPEEVVDQTGNTGYSPSLAFSPSGVPAVSYHACGPFDPNGADCPQNEDALRYAIKHEGRWRSTVVVDERAGVDGEYTAMVFGSDGQPVIAFQALFFDPIDNSVKRQLKVARGKAE